MVERSVFKARRVANPTVSGWLPDHAVLTEGLGYTPWQALAASTIESAEAMRLGQEVGALQPGRVADLLSVAGDPAQDVAALGRAVDVIQAGRPVKLGGRPLV